MAANFQTRHSRECGNPVLDLERSPGQNWIPGSALRAARNDEQN